MSRREGQICYLNSHNIVVLQLIAKKVPREASHIAAKKADAVGAAHRIDGHQLRQSETDSEHNVIIFEKRRWLRCNVTLGAVDLHHGVQSLQAGQAGFGALFDHERGEMQKTGHESKNEKGIGAANKTGDPSSASRHRPRLRRIRRPTTGLGLTERLPTSSAVRKKWAVRSLSVTVPSSISVSAWMPASTRFLHTWGRVEGELGLHWVRLGLH